MPGNRLRPLRYLAAFAAYVAEHRDRPGFAELHDELDAVAVELHGTFALDRGPISPDFLARLVIGGSEDWVVCPNAGCDGRRPR